MCLHCEASCSWRYSESTTYLPFSKTNLTIRIACSCAFFAVAPLSLWKAGKNSRTEIWQEEWWEHVALTKNFLTNMLLLNNPSPSFSHGVHCLLGFHQSEQAFSEGRTSTPKFNHMTSLVQLHIRTVMPLPCPNRMPYQLNFTQAFLLVCMHIHTFISSTSPWPDCLSVQPTWTPHNVYVSSTVCPLRYLMLPKDWWSNLIMTFLLALVTNFTIGNINTYSVEVIAPDNMPTTIPSQRTATWVLLTETSLSVPCFSEQGLGMLDRFSFWINFLTALFLY